MLAAKIHLTAILVQTSVMMRRSRCVHLLVASTWGATCRGTMELPSLHAAAAPAAMEAGHIADNVPHCYEARSVQPDPWRTA